MIKLLAALGQILAPVIREIIGAFMARAAGPAVESVTDAAPQLDTIDARSSEERSRAMVARFKGI